MAEEADRRDRQEPEAGRRDRTGKQTGAAVWQVSPEAARLIAGPLAAASAFASLGFGFASQAMGLWTGIAATALKNSQSVFMSGSRQARQAPVPARPEPSEPGVKLRVVEGGNAKREEPVLQEPRAAPLPAAQGKRPGKAAIRNAARSAAALGDPEMGKDVARELRGDSIPSAVSPRAATPKPVAQSRQPKAADRPETPDNFKAISGIGPKLEKVLNDLGIWTYAQLAGLAQEEIDWLEDHLGFGGRIGRDDWIGQAKALMPTKQ